MMENLKVLTIGGATQDIIIEYKPNPSCINIESSPKGHIFTCKEGSKVEVQKLHYAIGGGAINAAVSFKRLGFEVSSFFKIGTDQSGKDIIQQLESEGISPHYKTIKLLQTGTSFIIPSPNKDRIIFAYHGANNSLKFDDIESELIKDHDLIYVTALNDQAAQALPYIAEITQKTQTGKGIRLAVNPGTSQLTSHVQTLKASLSAVSLLILNAEEMHILMASLKPRFFKSNTKHLIPDGPQLLRTLLAQDTISFSLIDYFKEVASYGVKRIVVTNGKEGVYVATPEKIYFHPALPSIVVNTVGAGDAFGSTFTAMIAQGFPLEVALQAGVIQAQSVIAYQDAQSGLLSQKILEEKLKAIDFTLLKTFPFL